MKDTETQEAKLRDVGSQITTKVQRVNLGYFANHSLQDINCMDDSASGKRSEFVDGKIFTMKAKLDDDSFPGFPA